MKQLLFFTTVVLFGFQSFIHTQNNKKLDSLLQVYKTQPNDTSKVGTLKLLFDAYLNNDLVAAKKYANEELELSQKLKFKKGLGLAQLHLGVLFDYNSQKDSAKYKYTEARHIFKDIKNYNLESVAIRNISGAEYAMGNYDEALKIINEGIELFKKHIKDSTGLIPFYHSKGLIYQFKGNHKAALKSVMKELDLLKYIDNPISKADALNLLAQIEASRNNFQQAIDYNKEALSIYRKFNDKFFESVALNDIGLYYFHSEDYDSAISYLEQSLAISKEMENFDLQATSLTNLGKSYGALNQIDKGIGALNEALNILRRTKSKNKLAEALIQLAEIYIKESEFNKAFSSLNEAIEISETTKAKVTLASALKLRADTFAAGSNFELAFKDQLRFKIISDSIYNSDKSKQIEELRAIYDTEKKEQQILQQETEITLLAEKEKVSKLQLSLLGLGLILTLITFGFAYFGFRQKAKRATLEKEKLDTELAFKKKELTTHALHLAKKNELLEGLKQKAKELKSSENTTNGYQQLIRTIDFDLQDDNNWENFANYFQQVHKDFNQNVTRKYPEVTPNELRLISLVKMNLSIKEMANILNISVSGVKKARQRLRKKMNLSSKDSLELAVLDII